MKTSTLGPTARYRPTAAHPTTLVVSIGLLMLSTGLCLPQAHGAQSIARSSARGQAPFDPTGYWVSIITQEWRFRMVVPMRGDYSGIPLSLKGKQSADAWDPVAGEAAGKQCEAYGAAAIMRVPGRLRIGWQDENTLRVDTDAGMQTRLLHFRPTLVRAAAEASWQGYSTAQWRLHGHPPVSVIGIPQPNTGPAYGSLQVTTTNMLAGLLRKNGVPYSTRARMTEYWEVNKEPGGDQWLTVTTTLEDPEDLQAPYISNAVFLKEADGSGWRPTPCSLRE